MRAVICRGWGEVDELFEWYRAGKLRPCVTRRLPLEQSVQAIRLLTGRKAHGKVVVVPALAGGGEM
jgi:NADPH:quinone reductase-like Zn-dependent oxidoreductase